MLEILTTLAITVAARLICNLILIGVGQIRRWWRRRR